MHSIFLLREWGLEFSRYFALITVGYFALITAQIQCMAHRDCLESQQCVDMKCADPCPGACAHNSYCQVLNHMPFCACPPGFVGNPFTGCTRQLLHTQCLESDDCPSDRTCVKQKCEDPCHNVCSGNNTSCQVRNHIPYCTCKQGFFGDPLTACNLKLPDSDSIWLKISKENRVSRFLRKHGQCAHSKPALDQYVFSTWSQPRRRQVHMFTRSEQFKIQNLLMSTKACCSKTSFEIALKKRKRRFYVVHIKQKKHRTEDRPLRDSISQERAKLFKKQASNVVGFKFVEQCTVIDVVECFGQLILNDGSQHRRCVALTSQLAYLRFRWPRTLPISNGCKNWSEIAVFTTATATLEWLVSIADCVVAVTLVRVLTSNPRLNGLIHTQCLENDDCPSDRTCVKQKCEDPCHNVCSGNNTSCQVRNHIPYCTCKQGFIGDPLTACKVQHVSGSWAPYPGAKKRYEVVSDQVKTVKIKLNQAEMRIGLSFFNMLILQLK
ncbi:hypothetical protein J6590_067428 [Homalodisca vitripennis]|nr:hypothetical protein J6590_067428 [Homalodisca vitripennis]